MEDEESTGFSETTVETLKSFILAVVHDFVDEEDKPDLDRVVRELDLYFGRMPSLYRSGIIWLLRALEASPFMMGHRRRFSKLGREDQIKILSSFENSGNYIQRASSLMLKTSVLIVYLSEPAVERALGYDHECLLSHEEAG
ncbi:MAG: hypothetical protein R6V10_11255 [bacterium]